MELLNVFYRQPGLPTTGRAHFREAVRAIIRDGRRLLMVYSTVNGDYKFPGGGKEAGETDAAALVREVEEECGVRLAAVEAPFGQVIEYCAPFQPGYDLTQMTSRYYWCRLGKGAVATRLDDYEQDLGFQAAWVDLDAAIAQNHAVLAGARKEGWVERETWVLEEIRRRAQAEGPALKG